MNEIKKAFKKITPHRLDEIKEELKYRDENIVVETKKKKDIISLQFQWLLYVWLWY